MFASLELERKSIALIFNLVEFLNYSTGSQVKFKLGMKYFLSPIVYIMGYGEYEISRYEYGSPFSNLSFPH
jgi:hypothetical protein